MRLTLMATVLLLTACGGAGTDETDTSAPSVAEPTAVDAPTDAVETADVLLGTICYRHEDETATEGLEIEVSEAGSVTGYHFGTIHNEEAGYFAAFETDLSEGVIGDDDLVNFQTYTEVDGDQQTGEEAWILTVDGAKLAAFEDSPTMLRYDCAELLNSIWPPLEE